MDNSNSIIDFSALPEREISIQWRGDNYDLSVPSGYSILQAALGAGIQLPHSCKKGLCGRCASTLLDGTVRMRNNFALTNEDINSGLVLLCEGFPISEGVVIQQNK